MEEEMEIWDILDEDGNITGKTMIKSDPRLWEKGIYHQGADVWIINSKNEILIQKRAPQKKLEPNVWAMTGGSVIKGETPLETLKRETMEELGVELDILNAVKIHHYKTGNVWLDEFLVKQDINLEDIVMYEEEVSDVKFVTFDEVEKIYQSNNFIMNRWEFVKDKIKEFIED